MPPPTQQLLIPNVWHHRRVAATASKSCDVCHKPSTSVLITPDNKDFFYICPAHLQDSGFATPIVDQQAQKKAREAALEREIELVKAKYAEKVKERERKKGLTDKNKDKDKGESKNADKEEKEKDEKIKALKAGTSKPANAGTDKGTEESGSDAAVDAPRIFALKGVFYQKRVDRLKNIEMTRRNWDRLKAGGGAGGFPSVPTTRLG